MQTKYILMDIEGTVSDINFVKNVMFPYSRTHLVSYVASHSHNEMVKSCLDEVKRTVKEETSRVIDDHKAVEQLINWIDQDRKHPALKKIQGMIWKDGFESKAFSAPLYNDVLPAWKRWKESGLLLGIYSSGSVQAQKLFFGHTTEGDVLHYLSDFFDLSTGGKKDVRSYEKIAAAVSRPASEILFLSDIPEELLAARQAGFKIHHIVRQGTERHKDFEGCSDFDFAIE